MKPIYPSINDFQVTIYEKRSNLLTADLWKNVVGLIYHDPFAGKLPNFVQWMNPESRWPCWYSVVQGQGQTAATCMCKNVVFFSNIFWLRSLKFAKFGTRDAPREMMLHIDFQLMWSKMKIKMLVFILGDVYSLLYDPLFDGYNS